MNSPQVHSSQAGEWSSPHHVVMSARLHRYYGSDYLHFITTSCYQRFPWLDHARSRDLFLHTLEQVHCRYCFVVVG